MTNINQCIQPYIDRLMKQRYLVAMKEGLLSSYPFLLVGTLFLLPFSFPCLNNFYNGFTRLYILSVGLFSVYSVFSMGEALAKSYQISERQAGLFSVFTFLLCLFSTKSLSLETFSFSLFIGIVSTIITVEILRVSQNVQSLNLFPETVPSAVSQSFVSLIPLANLCLVFGFVIPMSHCIDIFVKGVYYLLTIVDSLPMILIVVFLITYFWAMGLHGDTLVSLILRPFWICMLQYNGFLLLQGQPLLFTAPEPFLQWFVWIGGSGTTLGLAFSLRFFMKSKHNRGVGKTAWISSLVNINEPIIFGTPIVSHPLLMIPFILAPMLCSIITWIAFSNGWVAPLRIMAVWTLPAPIGAFLSTGFDLHAILLNIGLILISIICYYPFVKIYDNRLLEEEADE